MRIIYEKNEKYMKTSTSCNGKPKRANRMPHGSLDAVLTSQCVNLITQFRFQSLYSELTILSVARSQAF